MWRPRLFFKSACSPSFATVNRFRPKRDALFHTHVVVINCCPRTVQSSASLTPAAPSCFPAGGVQKAAGHIQPLALSHRCPAWGDDWLESTSRQGREVRCPPMSLRRVARAFHVSWGCIDMLLCNERLEKEALKEKLEALKGSAPEVPAEETVRPNSSLKNQKAPPKGNSGAKNAGEVPAEDAKPPVPDEVLSLHYLARAAELAARAENWHQLQVRRHSQCLSAPLAAPPSAEQTDALS